MAYLTTGAFIEAHRDRFPPEQRADRSLLRNLTHVRNLLQDRGLSADVAHDLLARLIFVQFLSQREDSEGRPALDSSALDRLFQDRIIKQRVTNLQGILRNRDDTYAFFRWLNSRFNGDLFPGKGHTDAARELEWAAELDVVEQRHLSTLADFTSGRLLLDDGQHSLWPLYSFNAIPLEFISSIYESFVTADESSVGAHYTPPSLVDVTLDHVLPWGGETFDVSILDPSCGSGIFLVKAFHRLMARWRNSVGPEGPVEDSPPVHLLLDILRHKLFGIDINPHAIRVASFSLYLAMCDELDPRTLWHEVRFPRLRDSTLIAGDYFDVDLPSLGIEAVDLIVGNAPWGKDSATGPAQAWAEENDWQIVNKQAGTLFLSKALTDVSHSGKIGLIQPAASLLYNRSSTATSFRRKLLRDASIEQIVDLSALRFGLFPNSTSPACIVVAKPKPGANWVTYVRPRALERLGAFDHIVLGSSDVQEIPVRDLLAHDWSFPALAWGGGRNLSLLRRVHSRLLAGDYLTLRDLKHREGWVGREGYKRGRAKRTLNKPELATGRHVIIKSPNIDKGRIVGNLETNADPFFHEKDSKDISVFFGPLLLLAKTWIAGRGFAAAIQEADAIFPASSVFGFHFPPEDRPLAELACEVFNSPFATWFLSLTSGRAAAYRPEVLTQDLLGLPIGVRSEVTLDKLSTWRGSGLDAKKAMTLLGLKETEWAVIEDFVRYDLPAFRRPQKVREQPSLGVLHQYCEFFLKALHASVGTRGAAMIFEPPSDLSLDVRVVGIELESTDYDEDVITVDLEAEGRFLGLLRRLDMSAKANPRNPGSYIAWGRTARVFDVFERGRTGQRVPVVYMIKPNAADSWTRLAALDDADAVMTDVVTWHLGTPQMGTERGH